jgi:hypothetical protein
MAARRLLIVMLVLLGLSTLAAALVPQRTLNDRGTTGTTTTQPAPTTTTTAVETVPPQIRITVGPKKLPLVRAQAGDQFTLLVKSAEPKEIAIPKLGLVGFASPGTPARFELFTPNPGTFGILFAATNRVAAKLEVTAPTPPSKAKKRGKKRSAKPKKG